MLEQFLQRRETGEPLGWITGFVRFCGLVVKLNSGVYVPRIQSEELAERAGRLLLAAGDGARAADLCTGAGAIAMAISAAAPRGEVFASDLDPDAVCCAQANGVAVARANLGDCFADSAFHVVTAVAPYVPAGEIRFLPADVQTYEPRLALDGGRDGLEIVSEVVASAARLLAAGGSLLLELGGDQARRIAPVLHRAGFADSEAWHDDDGDLRGLSCRRLPVT